MSYIAGPSGEEKPRAMPTSAGYQYSDASSSGNPTVEAHFLSHLQNIEANQEMCNFIADMEIIGFPHKNLTENTSVYFTKLHSHRGATSSSKATSAYEFYHHDLTRNEDASLIVSSPAWNHNRLVFDDPSFRCGFLGDTNRRPCQGLSLSLSSSDPSTISLQSFDIRQQDGLRFGPSSFRSMNIQEQQHIFQGRFNLRDSKYLDAAQEILKELCSLEEKKTNATSNKKIQRTDEDEVKKEFLFSLDLLELQRRKAKLLQMLEEVERRYKHYCNQMKAVVLPFEAVAGNGAAAVYSNLPSKAMSRHFRCLRDGILGQIKATGAALGERDVVAPGTSRGETPRLKLVDQSLRQQRGFQQTNQMEGHPWRPQRGLPERSVSVLRAWLFEHFLHPYPSDVDKHILARQTGLSRSQVSNWFINARVRLWKPMVEEMYLEELKDKDGEGGHKEDYLEENQNSSLDQDLKPSRDHNTQHYSFGRVETSFGAMDLGFSSSYTGGSAVSFANESSSDHQHESRGGVSLTLGLYQQQGAPSCGAGSTLAPASQSSLFYTRDHHLEDCQTVQYSLLDSEHQNLPYRSLMGAQLLHDLAG